MKITTGLDFGTTNSTIGYNDGNKSKLINLSNGKKETRTVLFRNNEDRKFVIGNEGIGEFMDGYEGRLLQSVKSFLNSSMKVETYIGGKDREITEICSIIIKGFKNKLENVLNQETDSVLIGRPVKFHDTNEKLDKQAQMKLYEAAKLAGYKNVEFEFEPIGAVISYKEECKKKENVLVVDLGGGTSDFSIVNINPIIKGVNGIEVLANNGVYIGGDMLDYELSMKFFSNFLGKGTKYSSFGKELDISNTSFTTLSDWKNINKLLERKTVGHIQSYYNTSLSKNLYGRLLEIVKDISKGYEYYNLVKSTKEGLSSLDSIEKSTNFFRDNFNFIITVGEFERIIEEKVNKIKNEIQETIKLSGLKSENIDKVLITGGTGLIPVIRNIILELVGKGKIIDSDTFTSVGYGLTLESYEKFR